jgi:hypothetical protein
MANTLNDLQPDLYEGLDQVSRELSGFAPAVSLNATDGRAAVGQAVRYAIAPTANTFNIAPAMVVAEPTDQTIGSDTLIITKSKGAEFGFAGEEQKGLNTGPGHRNVQADMFAQGIRKLVNEIETDLAGAAVAAASRAHGAVATVPFASNMSELAQLRKILVDNGAPLSDLNAVVDTTAGANVHTLFGINTSRDISKVPLSEQGVLVNQYGFAVRETAGFVDHTAGTGASATTDAAGYAVGATTITLASAGTGTILAGGVIQFAGDSEKYVVVTGDADVSDGGTVVIQEPGLRTAIGAGAVAITLTASRDNAGVAFHRGAIQLVTRAPEMPSEQVAGKSALHDMMLVRDDRSGLTFEVTVWIGQRKVRYDVALAWGWKVTQPRHTALLIR